MNKNVIVTLEEGEERRLPKMVESLTKSGLAVQNTFEYGVVTGIIDEKKIKALTKKKGIQSVEEDQPINLPPNGSPLQ
jgi:hypothetical protein